MVLELQSSLSKSNIINFSFVMNGVKNNMDLLLYFKMMKYVTKLLLYYISPYVLLSTVSIIYVQCIERVDILSLSPSACNQCLMVVFISSDRIDKYTPPSSES